MGVKVAIFEDNVKFLEALSILVSGLSDLELVGAWLNTRDVIADLENFPPDVVLMDIGITPIDGIEATRLILENYPDTKILIQTIFEDDDKVFAAICAGASGYVLKSYLPAALPGSITEIMTGGTPMSPTIARKILRLFRDHFHKTDLLDTYNLTKREKEILKYLVEGGSYKIVADKCGIAFETVKTHIRNIYEKLHVASMSGAVAKAIRENLT
ncbi:MAG TPA: response regulator transcription factor [Puia sp.]|nr:response regulator transcription factor [Puia sp.]